MPIADVIFAALSLTATFTFSVIFQSLKQLFKNNDKFTAVWDSTTLKHPSKNVFKTHSSGSIKCTLTAIKLSLFMEVQPSVVNEIYLALNKLFLTFSLVFSYNCGKIDFETVFLDGNC